MKTKILIGVCFIARDTANLQCQIKHNGCRVFMYECTRKGYIYVLKYHNEIQLTPENIPLHYSQEPAYTYQIKCTFSCHFHMNTVETNIM